MATVGAFFLTTAAESTGADAATDFRTPSEPHGVLSVACGECHTAEGWRVLVQPLAFDHAETGFALEKGHRVQDCTTCHESLVFSHVPTACADCHLDAHRGEFGDRCEDCHAPSGWNDRRRVANVHDATLFPLSGAHRGVDCESCHREAPPFEYSNTPTDCVACHLADYEATREPDHAEAGFPTDCESCHRTQSWENTRFGANFNHDAFFPLTGAHAPLDCSLCHADGFAGTPTDCFSCHQSDYDSTRDPDHRAAGFPMMCESCHNTRNWEDADFDHSMYFPIERGNHAGLDCAECHVVPSNFQAFSCIDCHEHERDEMADEHDDVPGYVYESGACLECHPTGTE